MLHAGLLACRDAVRAGDHVDKALDVDRALAEARAKLEEAGFKPDYVALRDADTLGPVTSLARARLLAAAWLGKTRLIDNIAV